MLRLMSPGLSGKSLAFWIAGFSAFVFIAIIVHAVWFYEQQRELTIQRALTDAQNLASAVEENTRSTLQWTGLSLESLSHDIEALLASHATTADLRRVIAANDRGTPEIASFAFVAKDGTVISASTKPASPVNVADQPYFQDARSGHTRRSYVIAAPWLATGTKNAIALVRPVFDRNGAFAGTTIGTIDPQMFQQIHARFNLGKNSMISIFSQDGTMIARAPHGDDLVGSSFADDPIFRAIAKAHPYGSHYDPWHWDGQARFVAYRLMSDYPLVVVLGRAEGEVLTSPHTSGVVLTVYVVVLIALMSLFVVWILALARRQERVHRHLVATLDNVNQGVVVFDDQMKLVRCNRHYAEIFDLPEDFMKRGTGYADIVRFLAERGEYPGQTVEAVLASRLDSAKLGEEQRIIHRRHNGKVIVIYRKPMAKGGFIITFTDITDEIRIKEEAEAQARLLHLVLGGIQQGIRVFDKDMKLILANRRVVDTFGYPDEFVRPAVTYESTLRLSAIAGEYGSGDIEQMVQERMDLGRGAVNRGTIRRTPSGRYVKKQRDPIEGGGFVTTYTDVTDLIHAEAELARKSELLHLTQEHMGDGISVYDEHLRLINFNQRWIEIWGIPPELARVGTSYVDIMHRQIECGFSGGVPDPDRYIAMRVRDLLDKRLTQNELLLPDGRTILVRRFAAPNGIVVINHTDITRIKRAELDAERKSILLETVMDNIHQGILVCDADLRLIAFNDQFVSLLGYEPGDLRLGIKYEDVLRLAERFGNIRTDDLESFIAVRVQSAASRAHYRKEFQAYSGKYIALRRRPMPDGGFVTTVVDITNRKKAEMALQASEERYRSLVMSSTQLIWSTDASGNVVEPLPTWQKFTGQSDEEILGWGWLDALHPDDIEHVRRSWLTALETSSICSYEYRLRRHDGVYRAFNVRGVPVLNADGSVREWVGVSEDISDRKQAEAEVVAKSMLFEAILQNMAQGVTVYDQDSRLVAWNQRYVDLFDLPEDFVEVGRSHEEILQCLASRGAFGADADAQIKRRILAVRKRESYHREFTQSTGRTLFMSHTAMPGSGFVNTFTDISDRKRAEQALQDSEERLRAILDNIADAIITTDKAGLIQSCNLAAATIFEYGPDEVIGMDIRRLIPSSNFQPRNHGSGLGSNETVACRKDGALFPIDIAITSVELPGRWLQIAIVRDIGQQKALQAQLFQASKLATLGEMAAAMAHEMNQPLNVMRMAADNGLARLERKAATEEYLRQNLGLIAAQAERLGKLIMHMRVFSRVDPAEFELFDPRASVAAAVELMSPQIALGNIKINTTFPKECGEVLGLPSQLEQVMINLLSNAQDAIASNPVPSSESCIGTITMTMIEEERMVRIKVADTGGGIPPDVLGRIFDPFFTTKEVGKGTGLGLSVSYGIIAAMGGKIDVVSSMEGATFTVILPTRIAQDSSQTGQIGTGIRPISS